MNEYQQTAFDAVTKLNEELDERYGWNAPFLVISMACDILKVDINFNTLNGLHFELFSVLDEDMQDNESFYDALKRKFEQIKQLLNKIEL